MIGNELSNESNEWTAAQKPSDTGNMQQLLHCRVSFEVTIHALGFLSVSDAIGHRQKKSFFSISKLDQRGRTYKPLWESLSHETKNNRELIIDNLRDLSTSIFLFAEKVTIISVDNVNN